MNFEEKIENKVIKKIVTIWFIWYFAKNCYLDKISIFIKIIACITHKKPEKGHNLIKKSKNLEPKKEEQQMTKKYVKSGQQIMLKRCMRKQEKVQLGKKITYELSYLPHFHTILQPKFCSQKRYKFRKKQKHAKTFINPQGGKDISGLLFVFAQNMYNLCTIHNVYERLLQSINGRHQRLVIFLPMGSCYSDIIATLCQTLIDLNND